MIDFQIQTPLATIALPANVLPLDGNSFSKVVMPTPDVNANHCYTLFTRRLNLGFLRWLFCLIGSLDPRHQNRLWLLDVEHSLVQSVMAIDSENETRYGLRNTELGSNK